MIQDPLHAGVMYMPFLSSTPIRRSWVLISLSQVLLFDLVSTVPSQFNIIPQELYTASGEWVRRGREAAAVTLLSDFNTSSCTLWPELRRSGNTQPKDVSRLVIGRTCVRHAVVAQPGVHPSLAATGLLHGPRAASEHRGHQSVAGSLPASLVVS